VTKITEEVKEFLKIDGDDEAVTINSLIETAKPFIYAKTNYKFEYFEQENPQALLALKMLCLHWYENREPTGQSELIAMSLKSLLIHLQIEYGAFIYVPKTI